MPDMFDGAPSAPPTAMRPGVLISSRDGHVAAPTQALGDSCTHERLRDHPTRGRCPDRLHKQCDQLDTQRGDQPARSTA